MSAQLIALGIGQFPKWSAVGATESPNRYDLRRERLPTFPYTNRICATDKRHLYGVSWPIRIQEKQEKGDRQGGIHGKQNEQEKKAQVVDLGQKSDGFRRE